MRRAPDGSYFLTTEVGQEELIKKMDRNYERVPGELRWMPRHTKNEILGLSAKYVGKTCHIVGKGPSLDKLAWLPDGPVIAINEALHKVESIRSNDVYGMIQDIGVNVQPKFATLLLNLNVKGWYDFWDQKYCFKPSELGYNDLPTPISAVMAIKAAELMGCSGICMYAFDGCLNGSLEYAKTIGHQVSGDASRFLKHRETIEKCTRLPVRWMPIKSKPEVTVRGMYGLGDNLYQRGYIRELAKTNKVYLETPWPQFYYDLGITCVSTGTGLRTQKKNELINEFGVSPCWTPRQEIKYTLNGLRVKSVLESMKSEICPLVPKPSWITKSYEFVPEGTDFIIIKPPTIRQEWNNTARNPKVGYLETLAKRSGFKILSIGDLCNEETLSDPDFEVDFKYHKGEIKPEVIAALVTRAKYAISPVGFLLPLALVLNTPLFCIFGGHVPPDRYVPSGSAKICCAAPDPFCACYELSHSCNKDIPNLVQLFDDWRGQWISNSAKE
jgi:hypothetical protein